MTHSLDPFTSLQILRSMWDTHRMTFTDLYRHWAHCPSSCHQILRVFAMILLSIYIYTPSGKRLHNHGNSPFLMLNGTTHYFYGHVQ